MRKILVISLGFACLVFAAEAARAKPVQMSPSDLKSYCAQKGGRLTTWESGAESCTIMSGKNEISIDCNTSGSCIMAHVMVFTNPKSLKTGALGGAVSAAGSAGANANAGAKGSASTSSAAGKTVNTGNAPSAGNSSTGVTTTTKKNFAGSGASAGAAASMGGGSVLSNGRAPIRQQ